MRTRSWSTSTPSRPSCRPSRSSCSTPPRRPVKPAKPRSGAAAPGDRASDAPTDGTARSTGVALVVHPVLPADRRADGALRAPEARLDEAVGLARAIDLTIADAELIVVKTPRPATLIGAGQVERLGGLIQDHGVGVVVVDATLSPVQQRNLE